MVRIARFHRADSGSIPDVGIFLIKNNSKTIQKTIQNKKKSNFFQILFNNIT